MSDAEEHVGKIAEAIETMAAESPIADTAKQAASEMKTAFGSPHPDPVPEPPAAPTPEVNPAKQLNFNVPGAAPATPSTPALAAVSGDEVDYATFVIDTLLWKNKLRSVFYFVAGLLAWLVVRGVAVSRTTAFTGACYVLLSSLAFNFLRGAMAPKFQARCTWAGSSWTRGAAAGLGAAVEAGAALHDRYLNGLDPLRTLEVGLLLWVLSFAGRLLDVLTLLLALHLAAFSLPLAYTTYRSKVDTVLSDVYGKASTQYEKVDRRVRLGVVLAVTVALVVVLPLWDKLVGGFVVLAYGRVLAKPDEYAAVQRKVLEPAGKAVASALTPARSAAVAALAKYDLTPTPAKKKAA